MSRRIQTYWTTGLFTLNAVLFIVHTFRQRALFAKFDTEGDRVCAAVSEEIGREAGGLKSGFDALTTHVHLATTGSTQALPHSGTGGDPMAAAAVHDSAQVRAAPVASSRWPHLLAGGDDRPPLRRPAVTLESGLRKHDNLSKGWRYAWSIFDLARAYTLFGIATFKRRVLEQFSPREWVLVGACACASALGSNLLRFY